MTKTRVVNIHHESYDIYIGRSKDPVKGKWGNPFSNLPNTLAKYKVDSVKDAIIKYREWILEQPELLNSLHELKDLRLGCFCKSKNKNQENPCHGDVLVELIENPIKNLI